MGDNKFHYSIDSLEQFDKVVKKIRKEKNPFESLRQTDKLLKSRTFEALLKIYNSIDNVLEHELETLKREKDRLVIAHACIIFRSAIEAHLREEEKKIGLPYDWRGVKLKDGSTYHLSVRKRLSIIYGQENGSMVYEWYSFLSEVGHGDIVGVTDSTKWSDEKIEETYVNVLEICQKIIRFLGSNPPIVLEKIGLPAEPLCKDYSRWAIVHQKEKDLQNDINKGNKVDLNNIQRTKHKVQRTRDEDLIDNKNQKLVCPNDDSFLVKDLSRKELTAQEIYKFSRPNIVQVDAGCSTGIGFFIGNGYIITNQHVVGRLELVQCITDKNETLNAKVLKKSYKYDLALLKLTSNYNTKLSLKFSDRDCEIGQKIYVIGNSLGKGICLLDGLISDIGRNIDVRSGHKIINSIMFSAPIVGRNFGGPLFNTLGEVIGVVSASCDNSSAMNYAISIRKVKDFIK